MNTQWSLSLVERKTQQRFIVTVIFIVFATVLTLSLFFYSRAIALEITSIESELDEINDSIKKRESDPIIQSYSLYQRNAYMFETLKYQSMIPELVSHVKNTWLRYGIVLNWFQYNAWKLTMNAQASNDEGRLWYQKVVQFIQNYREDSEALFELEWIDSFMWHDRIEYIITLTLKETPELNRIFNEDWEWDNWSENDDAENSEPDTSSSENTQ